MPLENTGSPMLIRNVRPVSFGADTPEGPIDIAIGADGKIAATGRGLPVSEGMEVIDGAGAWISPGWTDLHVHIWHGGTDISIRPSQCGVERGVTTLVDAGSAGEANFHGFREYIIEPSVERVKAFLNLGSIGLVACNRVPELRDIKDVDFDRILQCYEENREHIIGIKVRASHVITGSWGITPVKLGKKIAKILKLPMMVHVGEGVRLDIGHGGASFSFKVAEAAIARGLMPFSISTDLHGHSLNGAVWDMATTMSKLLSVGMPFDKVIDAVTHAPAAVIGLPMENLLAPGARAEFTIFNLIDEELDVVDSNGDPAHMTRLFEPAYAIIGTQAIKASRHTPGTWRAGYNGQNYAFR